MNKKNDTDRPAVCRYCENAALLRSGEDMLCRYRGIVDGGHHCRKFVYDPLKRTPRIMPEIPKLDIESI